MVRASQITPSTVSIDRISSSPPGASCGLQAYEPRWPSASIAPLGRPLDAPLAPATPGASGISISRSSPQARRMSLTAVPSARLSGVTTIGARVALRALAGWLVVLVFSAYAVGQPAGNPPPQVTVNYRGTGVVLALLPPPSKIGRAHV